MSRLRGIQPFQMSVKMQGITMLLDNPQAHLDVSPTTAAPKVERQVEEELRILRSDLPRFSLSLASDERPTSPSSLTGTALWRVLILLS